MRLPIVQFPNIVVNSLDWFRPVFTTEEQVKHFCEYVTGLIVGDKATITAINELFMNRKDPSALNRFLTQATWAESELNLRRIQFELTRLRQRPVSARAGRLILDDTFAHHTHCSMDGLAYLRDHTINHNVWAHDVVTSYYVNRADQFPVDFRLYRQFNRKWEVPKLQTDLARLNLTPSRAGYQRHLLDLLSFRVREQLFQPKTVLAAGWVQPAVRLDLPFSVVLFDSWYCRKTVIDAIEAQAKDWVGACPKDRKVLVQNRWTQLQDYIRTIPADAYRPYRVGDDVYWAFTHVLPMQHLDRRRVRMVASYPEQVNLTELPNFYATNRKDWEPHRVLLTYCDRWPTETFNEDVKGHLGFEDYQLRPLLGIRRPWYLSFVAYALLSTQGSPGRSRWPVPRQYASTGERCRAVAEELVGHLVHGIVQQLQGGDPPDVILQTLLA